jgi:nitrite reductase/ring-hydroxylating ferredoxin subunit
MKVGDIRRVELPSGAAAVYRLADGFYATADLCSHGDASLADGELEDDNILCPYHLGSFCVRTGAAVAAPCIDPIATYPLEIVDGTVTLVWTGD